MIRHLTAAAAARLWKRRYIMLRWFIGALVAVGLAVVVDRGLGGVVHDRRQGELAADLSISRDLVSPGQALGVLQIPAIDLNEIVVQGDAPGLIRGGPAHRAGTPVPGELGNSVILAHRTRYGGPFGALDTLKSNDEIVFQLKNAKYPTSYRVALVSRVGADSDELLRASPGYVLTLVTSAPGLSSSDRVVVIATADGKLPPARDPNLAPTVSDQGFNGSRGSIFLNSTMAMAYLAALGIWVTGGLLATHRRSTRLLLMVPAVVAITYCVLTNLDLVLPLTS